MKRNSAPQSLQVSVLSDNLRVLQVFDLLSCNSMFSISHFPVKDIKIWGRVVEPGGLNHKSGAGWTGSFEKSPARPPFIHLMRDCSKHKTRYLSSFVRHLAGFPYGGEKGIRTLVRVSPEHDFQSCAFDQTQPSLHASCSTNQAPTNITIKSAKAQGQISLQYRRPRCIMERTV